MHILDAMIGLFVGLLIVYGLDFWTQSVREAGFRSLDVMPFYWGSILANLITAAILVALVWLVHLRSERSRLVAWLYLLSGVTVAISPLLLSLIPVDFPLFADPQFRILRISLLYTGAHSRLQFVGAFLVIVGGIGISPGLNRRLQEGLRAMWRAGANNQRFPL